MEKRIPRMRFKEFIGSGEWEEKKLGEVAQFGRGRGYSKNDLKESGTPIILYGSLYTDYKTIIKKVSTFTNPKSNTVYSLGNEVILPSSGETAEDIVRASVVEGRNIILGGDLNILYLNYKLNPIFLSLLISYGDRKKEIIKKVQGNSVVHLYNDDLKDVNISFPSLAEQEKIGNFFQKLDRLIDINREKLDKLRASKSAYLTEMFPREGEDRPRRRFQGFTGAWQEDKAKDICSISTGKSNTQDRNSDGKYPFYVRSPRIECSTKYLYNEEAVLTVGDGVGTGKVFHYVNGKYDLHQRVYRMFNFNNIMAKYFYYYFSVKFYDRVMSMTARTSVDSVRYEMISEMNILYPSMEEQIKIVKLLETFDQQIEVQEEKLEKLEKMKKAYLAEMFV